MPIRVYAAVAPRSHVPVMYASTRAADRRTQAAAICAGTHVERLETICEYGSAWTAIRLGSGEVRWIDPLELRAVAATEVRATA